MDLNQDCLEANDPLEWIVGAPLLSFFMEVSLGTILFKGPIIPNKCYSHILGHFIDVTIMIDNFILENY